MFFYLMRHGTTDWNLIQRLQGREDPPLNEAGIAAAHEAGRLLKDFPFTCAYTSPLQRAIATAEIVRSENKTDFPLSVEPELIERDYGKLSGMTPEQRHAYIQSGLETGVEDGPHAAKRIVHALSQIQAEPKDHILIVTHGGVINQTLTYLSDGTIDLGGYGLRNLGISCIERDKTGHLQVLWYNESPENAAQILTAKES